jgi:hypothetical protein
MLAFCYFHPGRPPRYPQLPEIGLKSRTPAFAVMGQTRHSEEINPGTADSIVQAATQRLFARHFADPTDK